MMTMITKGSHVLRNEPKLNKKEKRKKKTGVIKEGQFKVIQ